MLCQYSLRMPICATFDTHPVISSIEACQEYLLLVSNVEKQHYHHSTSSSLKDRTEELVFLYT